MGYNTTVVLLNDATGEIEGDPEFGRRLAVAMREFASVRADQDRLDVRAGRHANAASIVAQHHADTTSVILVGGNCATKVLEWYGWRHRDEAVQLDIIRSLAAKHGYRLVRENAKK